MDEVKKDLTKNEKSIFKALELAVEYDWISEHVPFYQYLKQINRMGKFLDKYHQGRLSDLKQKIEKLESYHFHNTHNPEQKAYSAAIEDVLNLIKQGSYEFSLGKEEEVTIWTRRHVTGIVWVIATDEKLEFEETYQATKGSEFPTKYFEVHDRWEAGSLYRYIALEQNNKHSGGSQ